MHPIVFFKESEEICSMTKPCSVCQNASSVCDTCSRSNVRAFYIGCKTCDFVMCLHCSATCRTFYFDSLALSDELSADIQMLKKNWTCNCCGDMHMAANCSLQALEDDEAVVFLNRMPPNCKVKKRRSESDEAQVVLCYRCALRFKLIKRTQHSRTHARTLAEESVRMFPTSS